VEVEVVLAEVGEPGGVETTPSTRPSASAWLLTSIATAVVPALAHDREQRLQVGRLGRRAHAGHHVVADAGQHRAEQAGGVPGGAQPASSRKAVVVLPLVPVTPEQQHRGSRVVVDPAGDRAEHARGSSATSTGTSYEARRRAAPAGSVSTARPPLRDGPRRRSRRRARARPGSAA
jgi:hypothetical protein